MLTLSKRNIAGTTFAQRQCLNWWEGCQLTVRCGEKAWLHLRWQTEIENESQQQTRETWLVMLMKSDWTLSPESSHFWIFSVNDDAREKLKHERNMTGEGLETLGSFATVEGDQTKRKWGLTRDRLSATSPPLCSHRRREGWLMLMLMLRHGTWRVVFPGDIGVAFWMLELKLNGGIEEREAG